MRGEVGIGDDERSSLLVEERIEIEFLAGIEVVTRFQ
jgi:hypothetical protein